MASELCLSKPDVLALLVLKWRFKLCFTQIFMNTAVKNWRVFLFFFIFTFRAGAESSEVMTLLAGYLKNDLELAKRAVKLRQAEISGERTGIENGIDLTINTGQVYITFEENQSVVSASPEAIVKLPAINGMNISVSTPLTIDSKRSEPVFDDTRFSVSADIIGTEAKQREISLLTAERETLLARRELQRRASEAEKQFYTALKEIYETSAQALSYEEDVFSKQIELAISKAQGYSADSVNYRTLELEVEDARRGAEQSHRLANRKLRRFARDCGVTALEKAPEFLPEVDIETLDEFGREDEKSKFAALETANWQRFIGEKERAARKNFELKAEGDITLNNTHFERGTSAGAALTFGWKGLNWTIGGDFPVSGPKKYPALYFSLSFNSGKQRSSKLDKREDALKAEAENLEIRSALHEWEDLTASVRDERADLIWERKRLSLQFTLYSELEQNAELLYRRGLSAEADYRRAKTNRELARYRLLAADAKIQIHLIDCTLYFVK